MSFGPDSERKALHTEFRTASLGEQCAAGGQELGERGGGGRQTERSRFDPWVHGDEHGFFAEEAAIDKRVSLGGDRRESPAVAEGGMIGAAFGRSGDGSSGR